MPDTLDLTVAPCRVMIGHGIGPTLPDDLREFWPVAGDMKGLPIKREEDRIGRELIARLRANARESTASLARALGLSRSAVQERIARLERDGVIAGYTVRLGQQMPGNDLLAIVRFTIDPKHTGEIVQRLKRFPEAEACFSVSGAFDLIVIVAAATAVRLNQVLQDFGQLRGVERTTSSIVLATEFNRRTGVGGAF